MQELQEGFDRARREREQRQEARRLELESREQQLEAASTDRERYKLVEQWYSDDIERGYLLGSERAHQVDEFRRRAVIEANPDWPDRTKNAILWGQVHLGMTDQQVLASMGGPHRILRSADEETGETETWVYTEWRMGERRDTHSITFRIEKGDFIDTRTVIAYEEH